MTMLLYGLLLLALVQSANCFCMTAGAQQQKQSVQQFDRRQLLGRCAAAAVTASSVLGAVASVAYADEAAVEAVAAAPAFSETITYREFNRLLLDKSIKRASFYGTAFSNCIVERSDGVLVRAACGYDFFTHLYFSEAL
jgi:hypothetical protein